MEKRRDKAMSTAELSVNGHFCVKLTINVFHLPRHAGGNYLNLFSYRTLIYFNQCREKITRLPCRL